MKILIVGGTSSLSKAIMPILAGDNNVITGGRKDCDIHIDLNNQAEGITIPSGVDAVIHAAAHFGGDTFEAISAAEATNVLGTLRLCQAAKEAGVKHFILISSIYTTLPENSQWYNIYTLSKKHAEDISNFYCAKYALPLTVLRLPPLYGNDDSFMKHQPFFYSIIDKAEQGEDISIYGSNDPLRNFIHAEDVANIIVRVLHNKTLGTFACVNVKNISFTEIAEAAYKSFGTTGKVIFQREKPDIQDNIFEPDDTLYKEIDYYPRISIEDGIRKIAEFRKNKK
jgi:nucleoside-diphosphate-sugar epimerase